jgi:hypothetical protein
LNIKFHENPFSGSRIVWCGRADMTTICQFSSILGRSLKSLICVTTKTEKDSDHPRTLYVTFVTEEVSMGQRGGLGGARRQHGQTGICKGIWNRRSEWQVMSETVFSAEWQFCATNCIH